MKTNLFILAALIVILIGCAADKANLKKAALIHYEIGNVYLKSGKTIAALKELTQSVQKDPKNPLYHNALGLAYYLRGFSAEAEEAYKKAVSLDETFSDAYTNLGSLYIYQSRWDDAIKEFKSALSNIVYATPEIAYTNMGWSYYSKGDYKAAIESLNGAIEANPRYVMAYNNKGLAYMRLGLDKEAEEAFIKAIEIFPDYIDANYNLGRVYRKMKDTEKAIKSFQRVLQLPSERGDLKKSAREYLEQLK